jgi:hypothetical protein
MNQMRKGIAAIALVLSPTVAFAYFDPGTGSLLIQGAIGAMAALAVFWGNVKAFIRSLRDKRKPHRSESARNHDKSAEHAINPD